MGEVVTGDGGIPVWYESLDGNRPDVGTVVATMEAFRKEVVLPERLVIVDRKLLSATALEKLRE